MPLCPCGSGTAFERCCGRYLSGEENAPTAQALMRSRYTAYVRGDVAYLERSWDPATRPPALGSAADGPEWLGLEIVSTHAGAPDDREGTVEFVARYRDHGAEGRMHEVSRFRKEDGGWLYVDGRIGGDIAPKVGRNDPCPCGSGKKFKKCCGA
jgi:SEC-C motif-containing protein